MKITRFKKTAAFLAAVGIVAVAGPASAAPPWVVTVGAQTTGQVAFSAYTKAPIQFVVAGPLGQAAMSCGQASAAGAILPGSYPTGVGVARIDGTAWGKCVGVGQQLNVYHVEQPNQLKWLLNLTGTTGPTWSGFINQINARVVAKTGPSICSFNVTGRANATFNTAQVAGNNNFTQTLTVNQPNTVPNLVVSNVVGCFGQITNGNSASFNGSFKVYNSVGLVGIS